jgi:hypothetical protein
MSIVSALSGSVQPILPYARLGTTGRFASPANPAAIMVVEVPATEYRGAVVGFQVGPNGKIFASMAAAQRYADFRRMACR